MDFRSVANRLQELGVTNDEMGRVLGVAESTVRAYRLRPESSGYRRAPAGWERAIVKLARGRSSGLDELAEDLERDGAP